MLNITSTTLYTRNDLEGHRTRLLAAEKGDQIIHRIVDRTPADLAAYNPDNHLPLVVDKNFILHGANLIDAFFEERYPTPALLPTSPIPRAKIRLLADNIRAWYRLAESGQLSAIQALHDKLDDFGSLLDPRHTYFAGQLYSFLDIAITPLLHIAPQLGYHIVPNSALHHYYNRLAARPSWRMSEPPDTIWTPLDVSFATASVTVLH